MLYKKAMSAIISIMLLLFIVVTGTAIIWKVLKTTVDQGLDSSKSCYDLLGKVSINNDYTCYNNTGQEVHVSVEVGDIEIEGLYITLTYEDSAKSFKLTNEFSSVPGVLNYTYSDNVKVPGNNSGVTYILPNMEEIPLSIKISPELNGNLCEGDSFSEIWICS